MRQYLTDVRKTCDENNTGKRAGKSQYLLPHVELVTLLTDVAGLTREKSEFRIYPNYHYTIDKKSKPIVIDILPHNHVKGKHRQ